MVCLYDGYDLVTKTVGVSKFCGVYQVGKEALEPSIKKRSEKKIFNKETLRNVYDMKGKNYVWKAFLYDYVAIVKDVKNKFKKRAKKCSQNNGYMVIYVNKLVMIKKIGFLIKDLWEFENIFAIVYRKEGNIKKL